MKLPFAKFEPVGRMDDGARDTRWNAVVLHTNGAKTPTNGDLFDWWSHGSQPGVGAHIQVAWEQPGKADDFTYQYLDTDRYTGHAWDANRWTVGVETEDGGNPATPWTDQQVDAIVAVLLALNVPAQLLKETPSHGVGYHQQYASWNKSNHNCPGPVRVQQIRDVIIPRLEEGDVATPDDIRKALGLGENFDLSILGDRARADAAFFGGDGKRPTAGQSGPMFDNLKEKKAPTK
jgi:N-acetylmuramoyl-L-alanine amidase